MRHRSLLLSAAILLLCSNVLAQRHEPEKTDTHALAQSAARIPTPEEVGANGGTPEPDTDVRVRGDYPYVWFEPTNATPPNNYWGSSAIQMNMNEAGGGSGPFMAFLIGSTGDPEKKFLFNRSVLVRQNNTTESAVMQVKVGNGTSSSKSAYTQYTASETTPVSWSAGLLGDASFRIKDTAGVSRMTITPDSNDPNGATINFTGTVTGSAIVAKYQDVAEWVPASQHMDAGTVVILNPGQPNEVMPSGQPYDTTVAGVVTARPGVLLGQPADSKVRVATTGRVLVNVDATKAPIHIGDLLVTGGGSGTAMRSEPIDVNGAKIHRTGTILGKALQSMPNGKGQILVLLTLQ